MKEGDLAIMASGQPVGLDVTFADLPPGDAMRGEVLYNSNELGCASCHTGGLVAPDTLGTVPRVEGRIAAVPELAGYSIEDYLVEVS